MAAAFTQSGRHRVAVLVRHGLLPMELGIVHQLFGQASSADEVPLYEVVTCTLVPGEVRTDADFTITVDHGPEALSVADTVIVPAAREDYQPDHHGHLGDALADALPQRRPRPRRALHR